VGNALYLAWGVEAHASCEVLAGSILPEPIEAVGAQLGISHCVRDVAVAEVVLHRAGVDAIVGELEAAAVAQHVRMSRERKSGQFSSPADHFEEPGPRHWAAAFSVEHEAALQVLPPQLPKGSDLLASEGMGAIDTVLGPPHINAAAIARQPCRGQATGRGFCSVRVPSKARRPGRYVLGHP